jgi:hypothetical protein
MMPEPSIELAFRVTSSPGFRPEIIIENGVPYIASAGWMEMLISFGCACNNMEVKTKIMRKNRIVLLLLEHEVILSTFSI